MDEIEREISVKAIMNLEDRLEAYRTYQNMSCIIQYQNINSMD